MKAYVAVDVQIHVFLASVLAGSEWPASHPGRFTPGTHWIRSWVGPRAGLDDAEKKRFLTLPGHLSRQLVASRYTDWAIQAPYSLQVSRPVFPFRQQNIDSDSWNIQLSSHDDIDAIVIVMKRNHAASVYIISPRTFTKWWSVGRICPCGFLCYLLDKYSCFK
jgi:hypothetical protein